jgi:ribosomal protein S18 acetylase RimI-like enzyme
VDDVDLARAEHENFIAAFATVARRRAGGSVRRRGGVVATVSGAALALFNQVVIEGDDATETAVLDAIDLVRAAGVPFVAILRDGPDDRFVPVVEKVGLSELTDARLPGMALRPLAAPPTPPPELEVRTAIERAEIDDHLLVNALASDADPAVLAFIAEADLGHDPDARIVIGWRDGRPLTTALGYRSGSTIGIYSVATVPEARRRGYGAAMTREIIRAGIAMGCDAAVLQSSPMGLAMYESLGFRTVVRYRAFGPPESAA